MPPEPSDADLEAGLAPADDGASWQALAEAWAAVERTGATGTWVPSAPAGTTVVDGEERPVWSVPYVELSDEVLALERALVGVGAVQPFDWMGWADRARFAGGVGLEGAPVADSVRVVTAVIRGDRFAEGTVLAAVEDGTLAAAVRRLLAWHAARGRT